MKASEIESQLSRVAQVYKYFRGFSTKDNIVVLDEEEFTIVNTEYVAFKSGFFY